MGSASSLHGGHEEFYKGQCRQPQQVYSKTFKAVHVTVTVSFHRLVLVPGHQSVAFLILPSSPIPPTLLGLKLFLESPPKKLEPVVIWPSSGTDAVPITSGSQIFR